MIDALVSGKLVKDPQPLKISKNGNDYCNFMMRVNQYDCEDTCLCSGIAFGECAEKVARLAQGDPLIVVGQVKLSEWTAVDGSTKHGLNITVANCLTPYEVSKRRGTNKPAKAATEQTSQGYQDGFDDDIPF